jgi:hypothetical protein
MHRLQMAYAKDMLGVLKHRHIQKFSSQVFLRQEILVKK